MLSLKQAEQFCKDNSIELKGKLIFDPYCGWIDESDKYAVNDDTGSYCLLCDLNIAEKFCDGSCGESCTIWD